ncbi:N66 matrix protein-like isoform X3 [Prunus avium]|uniref:N66 matrix protein-like isoform X3 n=1 Tax=Prunus avium TaxID=42229 RepID=A0A6P5TVN9_PRUAV|nr:N66 matrix protein-like isoform X3 [Prunus avium]
MNEGDGKWEIRGNEITAEKSTNVGISDFHNTTGHVEGPRGPERGHNVHGNNISADGSKSVGISNFGNHTGGYGSNSGYDPLNDVNWSSAGRGGQGKVPKGDGHDIRSNTIIGDGAEEGFHNFRNGTEVDGGSSNISDNEIRACNEASNVGMSNFHNQDAEGGGEPKSVVGHNICDNKISADTSTNVGLDDFGNIK